MRMYLKHGTHNIIKTEIPHLHNHINHILVHAVYELQKSMISAPGGGVSPFGGHTAGAQALPRLDTDVGYMEI